MWHIESVRRLIFWASFLKKHINYFKLGVNEHVIITHFHDFSKTFMIYVFSMTFPGLEMTILKIPGLSQVFHDRKNPVYNAAAPFPPVVP